VGVFGAVGVVDAGAQLGGSLAEVGDGDVGLFWGEDTLHELLVLAVSGAADSGSPLEAFAKGLKPAVAMFFSSRPREQARQRHAVIAANDALLEGSRPASVELITVAL
jgi:hypothetical protein